MSQTARFAEKFKEFNVQKAQEFEHPFYRNNQERLSVENDSFTEDDVINTRLRGKRPVA